MTGERKQPTQQEILAYWERQRKQHTGKLNLPLYQEILRIKAINLNNNETSKNNC